MLADRRLLRRRLDGLWRRQRGGQPVDKGLAEVEQAMARSQARLAQRRASLPVPEYPEELPVSGKRVTIAAAIEEHQVVVVAGETGSGKTTQLPKICLELGRGVAGTIGHTQPRRIAARSVATRIAEELKSPLGAAVGYKVRFTEHGGEHSHIKLMTDGILLAEIQSDPLLERYDTLIIDEAHERSLNIDFLLGYLKQLLPKRPDLKLIITSATINTERFAEFFNGAPVIEVSGRTYPVELRYRPLLEEKEKEADMGTAILGAVDELARVDPLGDILIFLAGERDIRETAELLSKHRMRDTEVIPLFSRLSASEQDRVFKSHRGRRIVLATNVAETSLTVPGIRFVIDPGLARISRYSHRTKVQRLPIEAVSQASANQRAGRCGRVSAGTCIRLYSEEDFLARPEYTDPEIRRTNLASVILQMMLMGDAHRARRPSTADNGSLAQAARIPSGELDVESTTPAPSSSPFARPERRSAALATKGSGHGGHWDIENFPFIDAPDRRFITDGFHLLQELGAVDGHRRITELGRKLARLPLDPRHARIVLEAERQGSLHEVLIIVSALTIQDPRERPLEAQQAADEKHARFADEDSDFIAYLNLWNYYHEQARHLSQSKLRKQCRAEFLSYLRMREWHDIHGQLLSQVREMGLVPKKEAADYAAIHRALLSGLLSNIGIKDEREQKGAPGGKKQRKPLAEYLGARNNRFVIFPGSSQAKKNPKWLVAGELMETSRLFARDVAKINPDWLEPLAQGLLKRHYLEAHWEKRPAQVSAYEQVSLYGLLIVPRRRVNYGPIDPVLSRELFIRHALIEGDWHCRHPFFVDNARLLEEIEQMESKSRRRDILVDEEVLFAFYDARLPEGIYSGKSFDKWWKGAQRETPRLLHLTREDLLRDEGASVSELAFPATLQVGRMALKLDYHFEPGHPADGVTLIVPLAAVPQLAAPRFEWLVPGLLQEKLIALIKSLPKPIRRNFVPAVNFATACVEALPYGEGRLLDAFAHQLLRMTGVTVEEGAWDLTALPPHLRMNFRVVDERGKTVSEGRDLAALQAALAGEVRQSLHTEAHYEWERQGLTAWDFEMLQQQVTMARAGLNLSVFPALVDEGESVAVRPFESSQAAAVAHRAGVRRLFMLAVQEKVKYLRKELKKNSILCLHYMPLGKCEELVEALISAAVEQALFMEAEPPRDRVAYEALLELARGRLIAQAEALSQAAAAALATHHAIRKALKGAVPPNWLESMADINEQLGRLIYPGFVSATPALWLLQLPRYLQGIERRLEKLKADPQRDRATLREMQPLWQRYWQRCEGGTRCGEGELLQFRWLLEELRVSLFAQGLKTLEPVSVPRLEKRWKSLPTV
jgi:ATP-dependent helicase HrpA